MSDNVSLSVVIPTYNRTALLPRAILSALACGGREVEVVVVPNGASFDWRKVRSIFGLESRVRFIPIQEQNACAARNAGLAAAKGKIVRFLDDDDVLFSEAAARQLAEMEECGADVCSGAIAGVDETGRRIASYRQPFTDDLVVASIGPSRATYTHAHLYRATALRDHRWNEDLPVGQDVDWMIRLCSSRELCWRRVDYEVGAWIHHRGERIYRGRAPGAKALRRQATMIMAAVESLASQDRLTTTRRAAAADGLWGGFQKGLMYEPKFWFDIASSARYLAPMRHPPSAIYKLPLIKLVDPRVVETLLIPARIAYELLRSVGRKLHHTRD